MNNMEQERAAFDNQTIERVKNGHIPDIRLAPPCPYFYNNSWRHPDYIKLDMGEQVQLIHETLQKYRPGQKLQLLEVGCGPGWLTLELARRGYNVTGIDLSPDAIAVARQVAAGDPWRESRGNLDYIVGDFFDTALIAGQFDAVIFLGALHHFADQERVMKTAKSLLKAGGLILAHEPTRDRVTAGNAAVIHLIRQLLAAGGGFYQELSLPADADAYEAQTAAIHHEMKYEDQAGGKMQSAHDNDAGHAEMCAALRRHFREMTYQERYAFFHEIIGGLRFDQEKNRQLARYLRNADAYLCRLGVLQSTEFFYVGAKEA